MRRDFSGRRVWGPEQVISNKRAIRSAPAAVAFALAIGGSLALSGLSEAVTEKSPVRVYQDSVLPILEKHCYECHGDGYDKGKVAFDSLETDAQILEPNLWVRVLLNTRTELYSLDAETGRPVASFGNGGVISLVDAYPRPISDIRHVNHGGSPPVVYRDIVIVGSSIPDRYQMVNEPPGIVQGFDAVITTGMLGAFWAVLYLRRRSVVAPLVSHAGFNTLEVLRVALMGA